MTLAQLLPLLRERGIRVWVENAQLRFTAPKGALTPELKSALTLHKETLLSVLGGSTTKPLVRTHARDARSEAPLSFAQQRLWLLEKLNPGSAVYNIPSAIRLKGKLDVEALRRSFEEIVRRHEALRTIFSEAEDDDGDPKQTVAPPPVWRLPIVDVGGESEVQRLATEEALRPFSLETGPLLRTTLLRLRMDEHILLFTTHHIASDGWSDAIVIDELTTLYRAYCEGKASPPLKDLELQYADFARWQRSPEQVRVLDQETQYWRDKLRGLAPLELPTDRPRPPIQSSRGALARRKIIDANLVSKIRRLGAEHEATTFMVLLAAFHVLLARYSGQSDIAVGTPIANRTHKETEPLIGFFVNTLVVRVRVDMMTGPLPAQRFEEVLKRTREAVLGAYAHQNVPFERIVAELQPERDRSRSPLFQVMFALQNAPTSALTLPELTLEPIDTPTTIAKFDLTLSVLEIGTNGFDCGIEYNTDLFDHDTIEAMLEHYERVLRSHEQPRIDLLTARERHHLVVECNDTHGHAYPDRALLHELFEAQVERTPHAIAVAFGSDKVTYDDLNRRANRLAHHLHSLGVASDVLVGVCLDRSIHMVVTLLAILKAGGAYVPLDPEYPRERLNVVAKDLSFIVTDSKLTSRVDSSTRTTRLLLDEELGEREDNPTSKTSPLSTAYVLYTSGSTGVPKGVAIAHRSVVLFLHSACRKVEREPLAGVLFSTSIAFDMSVFELFAPLAFGGAVVLARDALDLKTLEAPPLPITLVHTVPSVMREWIHLKALPQTARVVALGGESLARDLVTSIFAEFPNVTRVLNTYGPTEDTVWSIAEEFRRDDLHKDDRPPAIGVSIDNRRAYVLDADLDLVPCGVVGELWVAGDGLARGYLNQPALTADRFRPDPFSAVPGSRMYRTGDLARRRRRRQGGVIECLGRVDFQVKLRGFRIELQEIEARLLEHPDVRDTVVIAKDEQLIAYCVVKDPRSELANVLRDHLARALPKHMVPSVFVALDALPLTSNGKVDRKALPTPAMTTTRTQASPRDVIEMRLVAIWQELLEQPAIGISDSFFHLGGHSLIAVRLMSKLRSEFGCEDLPLATLFEHPTVEAFARLLREPSNRRKKMGSLVAMQRQGKGSRPTLFCVHPKGGNVLGYVPLANALGRDQPLYALQSIAVADETIPPDDTIEKMARRYVDAIREEQPSGPYHLLGYSLGGAIAYAMAIDLIANNNKNVASLILVDAPSPAHLARDRARDQTLDHFIDEYRLTNAIDHAELRALIDREGDEAALAHVVRIAAEANVLPSDIDLATVHRLLHVMTANFRAASSYRPLPLPPSSGDGMKVTLIRPNDEEEDDSLGWADVVGREMMTIHKVGGDHITMLMEPHVARVAQLIVGSISR